MHKMFDPSDYFMVYSTAWLKTGHMMQEIICDMSLISLKCENCIVPMDLNLNRREAIFSIKFV